MPSSCPACCSAQLNCPSFSGMRVLKCILDKDVCSLWQGRVARTICVYISGSPPLPPHFNVGSGVANSGCRPFMLVTVWWPRQQSSPTLKWGGRGGRQGQIAKLEPHYIDSTEKGSSHTPLTDTGAAQQLASQPLKCKIAHSRFLLPGMDTNKWSSPH